MKFPLLRSPAPRDLCASLTAVLRASAMLGLLPCSVRRGAGGGLRPSQGAALGAVAWAVALPLAFVSYVIWARRALWVAFTPAEALADAATQALLYAAAGAAVAAALRKQGGPVREALAQLSAVDRVLNTPPMHHVATRLAATLRFAVAVAAVASFLAFEVGRGDPVPHRPRHDAPPSLAAALGLGHAGIYFVLTYLPYPAAFALSLLLAELLLAVRARLERVNEGLRELLMESCLAEPDDDEELTGAFREELARNGMMVSRGAPDAETAGSMGAASRARRLRRLRRVHAALGAAARGVTETLGGPLLLHWAYMAACWPLVARAAAAHFNLPIEQYLPWTLLHAAKICLVCWAGQVACSAGGGRTVTLLAALDLRLPLAEREAAEEREMERFARQAMRRRECARAGGLVPVDWRLLGCAAGAAAAVYVLEMVRAEAAYRAVSVAS